MAYILISRKPSEEKKGASIIYISNQEPCKTGFHKTAFSSLLTSIRQISESKLCMYAAAYLQSGAVCMRRQGRIVVFFEDYSGIESPVESLEAPGPQSSRGRFDTGVPETWETGLCHQLKQSVSSLRHSTQEDKIDSSHLETDCLLLSSLFQNSSKANYS